MSLMDYFRSSRPKSASIAKERLQILVHHERSRANQPEYLADLQKDLSRETLELNIVLPENPDTNKGASVKTR